jgi:hypothetical protein
VQMVFAEESSHRFRRLAVMVTGKSDGRPFSFASPAFAGFAIIGTNVERFSWNTVAETLPDIHTLGTALALICYIFSQFDVL